MNDDRRPDPGGLPTPARGPRGGFCAGPGRGAVAPGAGDAHLRAAVVAPSGGQGDRHPRPLRGDPDAVLPGAQRPGGPTRRTGRRPTPRPTTPAAATRAATNAFVSGFCAMRVTPVRFAHR